MRYPALYVRAYGDVSDFFAKAAINKRFELVGDDWDGPPRRLAALASEFSLTRFDGTRWVVEMGSARLTLGVSVTDCRIVFLDTQALAAGKAASPVRAGRILATEKILCGHIRYEWLAAVGYLHKNGPSGTESVALAYTDSDKTQWSLTLTLLGSDDAARLAELVLHQCAAYRLAMTDPTADDDRHRLAELAACTVAEPPDPRTMTGYSVPVPYEAPHGGEPFRPERDAGPVGGGATRSTGPAAVPPAAQASPTLGPNAQAAPQPVLVPKANFCANCGSRLGEGNSFCGMCGAPIAPMA
jgi:hypothetical protein